MTSDISPIDAANAMTPRWMKTINEFDVLEVHPCTITYGSGGTERTEQCEPSEADFWTVFGHYRCGGLDDFGDFPSEREALAFRDLLLTAYPHLGM